MLRAPAVKAALSKALKEQEKRTLVTADQNLLRIEQIAMKAEAAGEYSAAARARELIGKHYSSFTDKLELSGRVTAVIKDYTGRKRGDD